MLWEPFRNDARWLQQGLLECARAVAGQRLLDEARSERSKEAVEMVVIEEMDVAPRITEQVKLDQLVVKEPDAAERRIDRLEFRQPGAGVRRLDLLLID